ncbi:MAG: RIP metalloprotease RseP [Bacteroidaceae bacterium]|nr:RIP metalloprotease RseP [Bacteroidaceae bacterium]
MSVVLIKALQLLCCLSLLVVLHEFGHFGFSKLFGVKVEKFYMFFNPYFHLFSTRDKWFARLFPRIAKNETEYGIGWVPLGGYVKIAGMIDESMDTEQMKQPAQADEFRSQKVWKRFLIMAGGVLMNLITALVIYSAVMFTWGRDYLPMRNVEQGFQFNEHATELGFRDGDIPVAADGKEIAEWNIGTVYRALSKASSVTVLRGGQEVTIQLTEKLNMLRILQEVPPFLTLYAPAVIDSVLPGSAMAKVGGKAGDRLLSVDGHEMTTWTDFDNIVLRRADVLAAPGCTAEDSLRLRTMDIVLASADGSRTDTFSLQLDENYLMGILRQYPVKYYESVHQDYNLVSCIPAGLKKGWDTLKGYVSDLRYVATADGAKSVGSFITIGNIFPSAWDWHQFWMLTAFISIILAVMNILPIPGLDGGHIVLLLYEAVTGRQPSDRAMEWIERIGIVILVLLMLLAFSNDIRNFVLPLF